MENRVMFIESAGFDSESGTRGQIREMMMYSSIDWRWSCDVLFNQKFDLSCIN